MISDEIKSSTSVITWSTPPSGNDVTSLIPVLAPLGAAALPNPFHVKTSASTVGFPLLSIIFLKRTSSITLSIKKHLFFKCRNSCLIKGLCFYFL